MDLGSQVGAKLGGKIEPRQAKTGQDKGRQGKRREGKGKEEEGKGLEGIGRERVSGGDSALGGEGFTWWKFFALKRSVTLNREVTSKALD